jgi:hypothetical protein
MYAPLVEIYPDPAAVYERRERKRFGFAHDCLEFIGRARAEMIGFGRPA